MKLTRLRLNNFRQFAGDQALRFADTDQRSVTLLFGANGSGKTTLLNAFTWCLYGSFSDDVEGQDRLITDYVWKNAEFGREVGAFVELEFEHNGNHFRAKREVAGIKAGEHQELGPIRLRLWETDDSGQTKEVTAAAQRVESVLPEPLSRFFFFNGERIESLVSRGAYAEVKQAIKSLLGLEQVERAIEHLPRVERKLQGEVKKYGGEKLAEISTLMTQAREQAAAVQKDIDRLELEHHNLGAERDLVLEELGKHREAGPLQQRRQQIESEIARVRQQAAAISEERRNRVAQDGPIAFLAALARDTEQKAEALAKKGELPAPIKRDFVEALLEGYECLCGTSLAEGSDARKHVEHWKARAGLADAESAWQRLRGSIAMLEDSRRALRSDLELSSQSIADLGSRKRELEEQLTVVDAELKDVPLTDVQRLNDKQIDLTERMADANRQLGAHRVERETQQSKLEALSLSLKNAEVKDQIANRVRSRVALVEEVQSALVKILEIRTETVRRDLDERIRGVFKRITVKPFEPHLNDDFELRLVRPDDPAGHTVSKSTGENQILSLSFVAAVSELAADYRSRNLGEDSLLDAGGRFPIVMDAAFGSLDENYQRDVSDALSRLAPQMIVLVSKSQGLGTVLNELEPHIGELGVIVANSSKSTNSDEDIELRGRSFPYIRTQSDADYATLLEVN